SSITVGPDGNIWFAENAKDNIGMITTAGTITEYPISANSQADGIVAGPDGNIWFAARGGDYVGRLQLAAPADTTPPTVSVTAPSANATVTGSSVTLSATAADNVGVTGVQFKV